MEFIRLDFIFSYWIFLWFVLYKLTNIIKYSPKFIIILGIIENFGLLLYLIYKKSSYYNITKFIIINTFIKIIPLYLIINDKIILRDVIASIILFLIYLLWLFINNKFEFIFNGYNDLIIGYTTNKTSKKQTFISYLYEYLYRKIFK
jgi:hypothetical protein